MDAVPRARPGARRVARLLPIATMDAAMDGPMDAAMDAPQGCPFAPRCGWRQPACLVSAPPLRELQAGHSAACHRAEAVAASGAA